VKPFSLCPVVLAGLVLYLAATPEAGAVSFNRADRNGDGVVGWDEARVAMRGLAQPHFDAADVNGDGVIAPNEFPGLQGIWEAMRR
jgi:hypothetical protein